MYSIFLYIDYSTHYLVAISHPAGLSPLRSRIVEMDADERDGLLVGSRGFQDWALQTDHDGMTSTTNT